MDENRYYYKQNTYTNNASDDSSCTFPLPWLTEARKRRSRLGKHGRHNRVLQEINNENNNIEQVSEIKELHKASDKDSISLDYIKPTDTDSDSHDVGCMKSNDVLNSSFIKLPISGDDVSYSNVDTADMMDISVSKADPNHDMDFIEAGHFSSPDEMRLQNRNAYSPQPILRSNNHSSFDNDVLNLQRKTSYSPELMLKTDEPSCSKVNDVLNFPAALPIDTLSKTSGYSSLLDDVAIESNHSPFAIDLVLKNNYHSSPNGFAMVVNHQTPLPADVVLKTNDNLIPNENTSAPVISEDDSRPKSDNCSSRENISADFHRSSSLTDFTTKTNDNSLAKDHISTDPDSALFAIDFVSKKVENPSLPERMSVDSHLPTFPIDFAVKKNNYSSPLENMSIDSHLPTLPIDFAPKKNDYSSPKANIILDSHRQSCPADSQSKNDPLPTKSNDQSNQVPQRTPFSSEPLHKVNQLSPKKSEISNPIQELFPKHSQFVPAKPISNGAGEFKQPEAIRPQKKDDFQFEAPLPPPNLKINEKLPAFITVKGKSYSVTNVLGSGGSSMVYQVLHPEHGEILAIKQVKLSEVDESIAEGYIDEVKLLKKLQKCESIIKMYDHEIICENDKKLLNVVMEKGDTDLAELLKNVNKYKKPSIYMILYYWTEMLSAVYEIHNEGIIHSDLKPANFLIVKGSLKLIDFGIASSMQGDMTSVYKDVFTGTLNYMSPEAVQFVNCSSGSIGYRITYKTDVWSLGCILYHLIYGRLPFQHLKKKWDKMRAIVDSKIEIEFPEVKGVPSVLMTALKSCLDKDPKKRMSVGQLLQLPYCGN